MTPLSIKTHLQLFTVSHLAQLKRILYVMCNTSPLPRLGGPSKAQPEQMGYPTVFLKRQVLPWSDLLTTLFNISLRLSRVPGEWKRSVISPLFKGGNRDRQEAKNYRPISLTSCVARVMEKLLNEQILNYLQDQSLICNEQAGFLPGQSTVTQLCFLINRWQVAIDRGEGVEAIFLDLGVVRNFRIFFKSVFPTKRGEGVLAKYELEKV